MREYQDRDKIPPTVRELLRQITGDQEVHADFWNNRNRALGGRPRDVWHQPGGASKVKAYLRRRVK